MKAPCARVIYPTPARNKVRAEMEINPRTERLVREYQPRRGHVDWPPGFKERLATRGALAPEPEED